MSIFNKVRSGQLSKEGFIKTLAGYEAEKIELIRTKASYGPELFNSKLNDLNMSISMTQLFIDKYDELAKGSSDKTDKSA